MKRHFYDVGANVGQTFDNYLLPGEFRTFEVFCFEPSPRHLSALRQKAEAVRSRFRGVTVIPAAVGEARGFARLWEKRTPLSDSLDADRRENISSEVAVVVPVMTLSDFILQHSADAHLEVKVDAEGSEYGILADLLAHPDSLGLVRSLHVEWHDSALAGKRSELERKLSEHGVEVKRWPF